MQPCPYCVSRWVERACVSAGIRLTDLERRRLIAGLLARRHLILSGPAGSGKARLARALALSLAQGQERHVRTVQGHPWWAAETGDVARYVNAQMDLSLWRLADFVEPVLPGELPPARVQVQSEADERVACVERVSQVEIDLYFDRFCRWLAGLVQGSAGPVPLRLIGTYDSEVPPDLGDRISRLVALVHLGGTTASDDGPAWRGVHRRGEAR